MLKYAGGCGCCFGGVFALGAGFLRFGKFCTRRLAAFRVASRFALGSSLDRSLRRSVCASLHASGRVENVALAKLCTQETPRGAVHDKARHCVSGPAFGVGALGEEMPRVLTDIRALNLVVRCEEMPLALLIIIPIPPTATPTQ